MTGVPRSAAVWSSVGHVVGLGDRHGENLLIHTESGECVHVDFDCLFDKVNLNSLMILSENTKQFWHMLCCKQRRLEPLLCD